MTSSSPLPPPASPSPTARVERIVPLLHVRSVAASVAWYVGVLGFREHWHEPGVMASVVRDDGELMLSEGVQGAHDAWVWIGVDDARRAHAACVERGATVRMPLTNLRWALEFQVQDHDGHVLRVGSAPLAEVPFGTVLDDGGTR
mgnify:CR=1 FL=1